MVSPPAIRQAFRYLFLRRVSRISLFWLAVYVSFAGCIAAFCFRASLMTFHYFLLFIVFSRRWLAIFRQLSIAGAGYFDSQSFRR
jgi:hypothetical protein